jgi:regulator of sigma E protease
MIDFTWSVLSIVVVFGTVVVVHELGHFAAAKYFKIRVEAFSVGFGPRLFGFRRGETDYKVCAIPLGGYVKMAGENPDDVSGGVEEFLSHPKWQRFIVAVMGPVMNGLLAVVLLTGLFYHRYEVPIWPREPVVLGLLKADSPARKTDLRPGDRIVAVAHKKNPTWEEFLLEVTISPGVPLQLQVERERQTFALTLVPEARGRDKAGYLGIAPFELASVMVRDVLAGKPAAEAGMLPGDRVVKVGGVELNKVGLDLVDALAENQDPVISMTVLRNGQEVELEVAPYRDETTQRRMIGVLLSPVPRTTIQQLSLPEALDASVERNIKYGGLLFEFLHRLLRGTAPMSMVGGPIAIAKQSSMAAKSGITDLIMFIAVISINLGIVNLLPIPILDGGVIAIILVESLVRRDLSLNVREKVTQVGFIMVILLVVAVTYNDIIKSLPASLAKYFP